MKIFLHSTAWALPLAITIGDSLFDFKWGLTIGPVTFVVLKGKTDE